MREESNMNKSFPLKPKHVLLQIVRYIKEPTPYV